jgi:autotransporter-associated beta strand protein
LNFRNDISFSNAKRTVRVEDGAAAVDAILSGRLIGTVDTPAGLNKTGPGVLSLTSTNTYPGTTTVGDGVLRLDHSAALPSGNLELTGGGILGLGAADLTNRTIGSGVDQLRWSGDGGFAAFGADRVVRFTPEPDTSPGSSINWIATNFIGGGRALILAHDTSDATIDWQQRISLAGSTRIIQVNDGSAEIDAKMSGIVAGGSSSNTNNRFNKTGPGTLAFTAQNSYWGNTIVSGGTLMIGDGGTTGGVSMNSSEIIVEPGATLAVNRADTVTQGTDPFAAPVTGDGGFAQVGAGNTVLTLANTYIGPTRIDAGTLTLGAAGVLPDGTEIVIGNATLAAGSVAETVGRLDIDGPATIHLGAGASLAFANSSSVDWTDGTLDLTGAFVSGASLRFGNDSGGLSPSQLALITINGIAGHLALDANGYLVSGGYTAWKAANAPNTGNDPNADEDGDGVTNGVEYVLGGSMHTRDNARLPQISTGGGNLLFTFKRDQASIDGSTVIKIELSPDLTDWSTAYPVPDGAAAANPGVTVIKDTAPGFDTVTLALPLSDPGKFARLKVTP